MKIECIGLKPDHGQSSGRDGEVIGRTAHAGGWAAHSSGCSRLASSYVVLYSLLSEFHDFHDQILSYCRGVSPPNLFSCITFCTTLGDNTYPK
jgi:hypothetical protein